MAGKTIKHDFKHPIEAEGKTFASITLREPDVDALEAIDELGIEPGVRMKVRQVRGMLVILGDMPDEAVGKMHRDDFAKVSEMIVPLLDPPEEETSPPSSSSGASSGT
jgi:hypothetical protein